MHSLKQIFLRLALNTLLLCMTFFVAFMLQNYVWKVVVWINEDRKTFFLQKVFSAIKDLLSGDSWSIHFWNIHYFLLKSHRGKYACEIYSIWKCCFWQIWIIAESLQQKSISMLYYAKEEKRFCGWLGLVYWWALGWKRTASSGLPFSGSRTNPILKLKFSILIIMYKVKREKIKLVPAHTKIEEEKNQTWLIKLSNCWSANWKRKRCFLKQSQFFILVARTLVFLSLSLCSSV